MIGATEGNAMSGDASTHLIRAIVDHMRGAPEQWAGLALVIELRGGRIRATHGFAYLPDGTSEAIAARPSGVQPALDAYLSATYRPDQEPPVQLLVQFDRDAGRYEITFEDADAARWQVTPLNVDEVREQLRPRLA